MENIGQQLKIKLSNLKIYKNNVFHWDYLTVDHSSPQKIDFNKQYLNEIRKKMELKSRIKINAKNPLPGIYVYFKNKNLLYIGKGKGIAERIYNQYKACHNQKGAHKVWVKFWKENLGILKVYYHKIDDNDECIGEALRIIIERYMIASLKPKFEIKHKSKK